MITVTTTRPKSATSRWLASGLAATGVLVIFFLVWRVGPHAVLRALASVGPGFIAILIAPLGGMALHCWGWLSLLPASSRPSPRAALAAYVAAQAGDELGAGIGGEPLKVLVMPDKRRARAAATLALDNAAQLMALGIFMLTAALVIFRSSILAVAGLGLAAAGLAVPLVLPGMLRRATRGSRWPWVRRLARIGGLTSLALRARPRRMLAGVLLHLLGKAWIIPEMAIALFLLKAPPGLALALGSASVAGSVLGAFIPGQVGAIEAALAAAGGALGMEPTAVMAVALLRRIRGAAWIGLGFLLAGKVIERGRELV